MISIPPPFVRSLLPFVCLAAGAGASSPLAGNTPAPAAEDVVTELRITRKINPTFPQRLIDAGIARGEAHIAALIDAEGRVVDSLVVAYTEKDFADSAMIALGKWKFEPTQVGGRGASTVLNLQFQFNIGETLVREKKMGDTLAPDSFPAVGFRYRPRRVEELDAIPHPVHVVEPTYPTEWRDSGITGRVTLTFFIDEQGRPRMPVAAKSAHPALAAAAIEALEQWQFDRPTSNGFPALVRVTQEFFFAPKDHALP